MRGLALMTNRHALKLRPGVTAQRLVDAQNLSRLEIEEAAALESRRAEHDQHNPRRDVFTRWQGQFEITYRGPFVGPDFPATTWRAGSATFVA
jgi:hypothetical protein